MNPLLYGSNDEERIVAVQPNGDRLMRVYSRGSTGIHCVDHNFYPFFFLSDASFLKRFSGKHWIKKLQGDNFFQYLCAFTSWSEMWDAVRLMFEHYNADAVPKADRTRLFPSFICEQTLSPNFSCRRAEHCLREWSLPNCTG